MVKVLLSLHENINKDNKIMLYENKRFMKLMLVTLGRKLKAEGLKQETSFAFTFQLLPLSFHLIYPSTHCFSDRYQAIPCSDLKQRF